MIKSFTVRKTQSHEQDIPYLTSSMMEALLLCPRWGVINSVEGRRFVTGYRQMALEAGSLLHDVFATFNLIVMASEPKHNLFDHADFHGEQLFGKDRWDELSFTETVSDDKKSLDRKFEQIGYDVIGTSDFYDDPNDRNRTTANLEMCMLELSMFFQTHMRRIYIGDYKDPTKPIGIEQSIDVIFEITDDQEQIFEIRFIGLADAVYQKIVNDPIILGEYKTTSRINDGWIDSFKTRHQQTGYLAGLSAYFPKVSEDFYLIGSTIPVRTTQQAVQQRVYFRDDEHIIQFLNMAMFAKDVLEKYQDGKALEAPMFTHSCNRYFRTCSLMDLCTGSFEDQVHMYNEMEIVDEKSPSEMKALLGYA